MGKGQKGLVKRNSNYFEDILPNTIDDAKTRKLTYKQLKQVEAETKYFVKEKENLSKALKLEAKILRKQKSRVFHRRRGMLCNLRSLKKLKAEVAAIGEVKWRDSLIRIQNIKLKEEEYKHCQREKERLSKNRIYKRQSSQLLQDFKWFEGNSNGKSIALSENSLKNSDHSQSCEIERIEDVEEHASIQEDIIAAEGENVISDDGKEKDIEDDQQTLDNNSGCIDGIEERKDRLSEPIIELSMATSHLKGNNLIPPLCNVESLHVITEEKKVEQQVGSMEASKELLQDASKTVIKLDQHFIERFSEFALFRFDEIMTTYAINIRGMFVDEPVFFSLPHFKEAISIEPISVESLKLKILPVVSENDSTLCNLEFKELEVIESIDMFSESRVSPNWSFVCHHLRRKNLWRLNKNLFYEDESFFSSFYDFNVDIIEDTEGICLCCSFDPDINVEKVLSKLLEERFNCVFIRPKQICEFLFNFIRKNSDSYNITSSSEFNDFLSTIKSEIIVQDGQKYDFSLLLESNSLLEYIQHILPLSKICLVLYDFQPTDEQRIFLSQNFSRSNFEHFTLKPPSAILDEEINSPRDDSSYTIFEIVCNVFREKFNLKPEKYRTLPDIVQYDEQYFANKIKFETLQFKISSRKVFSRELVDQIGQYLQSYQDELFGKLVFEINTDYLQKSISRFNARSCELQKNINILELSSKKTNAREKRLALLNKERKKLCEEKTAFLFNVEEAILMSSLELYFDQIEHLNNMKGVLKDFTFRQKENHCLDEVREIITASFFDVMTVFANSKGGVELGPVFCLNQLFMFVEDGHCYSNEKVKILELISVFQKSVDKIKHDIVQAYSFPKAELNMLLDELGKYTLQKLHTSLNSIWHIVSTWKLDYHHQYVTK